MLANNALLGGGVRVRIWIREQRKIKGTTKPLLANLDITLSSSKMSSVVFLLQLVPVTCSTCRKNFCLKHRFETDHDCQGPPNRLDLLDSNHIPRSPVFACSMQTWGEMPQRFGHVCCTQPRPQEAWEQG